MKKQKVQEESNDEDKENNNKKDFYKDLKQVQYERYFL